MNLTYDEHAAVRTLRAAIVESPEKATVILEAIIKNRTRDSQIQMALLLQKEIKDLLAFSHAAMAFTKTPSKEKPDETN